MMNNSVLKKLLNTEVSIMHKINHPNIMHLYDYFETENNYYLVINYCNKGDLETYFQKQKIKFLDERDAIQVLKQIMNGFVELRRYKVMHRDLKLSNIFMHNDRIVIGDFGLAKTGKEMSCTKLGTPLMMAPELIEGTREYSSKTDLWSIGIVFYQLLFGKVPFFGLSLNEVYAEIDKKSGENLKFPSCNPVSKQTQNLLKSLLQKDPIKRIEWKDFFYSEVFCPQINQMVSSNSMRSLQSVDIENPNQISHYTSSPTKTYRNITVSSTTISNRSNQTKGSDMINCNIRSSELIQPKKVDNSPVKNRSIIVMSDVIKSLTKDELIQENSYRYCHELNKINFLVNTCRRAINYITSKNAKMECAQFILPAIVGMFSLSYLLCTEMYMALLARENIYELYDFKELYSSERYEYLIDYFSKQIQKLKVFKKKMVENSEFCALLTNYQLMDWLDDTLGETDIKTLLVLSSKGIFTYFFCENNDSEHMDHELLSVSVFIALSLKLREMFPYWIATKKFKWENFVINYENMENQKLLSIIKIAIDNESK